MHYTNRTVYYFYSEKGLRPILVPNCNLIFSWKGKCFITLNSIYALFLTASKRPKITMKKNIFLLLIYQHYILLAF